MPSDQPSDQHQVGITNAQENNPDADLAELTRRMNAHFGADEYAEAGRLAMEITARSRDELASTFQRHAVAILRLDHEAFGIYEGRIEPTYDLRVDGATRDIVAAATEFGKRHAQEMVIVARMLRDGESDPAERLGATVVLQIDLTLLEADGIARVAQQRGFAGATFIPKGQGTITIYHTDNLGITQAEFEEALLSLFTELQSDYPHAKLEVRKYIIHMPRL